MPDRRSFLKTATLATGAAACSPAVGGGAMAVPALAPQGTPGQAFPNHVPGQGLPVAQQSVARWCYGNVPLPELLPKLREIGLANIDLITPQDWAFVKDQGFTVSMAYGRENEDITTGYIDANLHDTLNEAYGKAIPEAARMGWKSIICFAGNRRGRNDMDGLRTAAAGLRKLMPIARDHDVLVQMELFNSKVNHPDYMADSTAWSVALCDMVDSEHFKLLYDIYHMAVQEGNVIQTIQQNHDYFGHYHTAGLPGRHELNEDQELYYPAVMRAIRETGFAGYCAHEFIATYDDRFLGLREAVRVCS